MTLIQERWAWLYFLQALQRQCGQSNRYPGNKNKGKSGSFLDLTSRDHVEMYVSCPFLATCESSVLNLVDFA